MTEPFTIPDNYHQSFRRLFPYLDGSLQNDQQVLGALLLFLKIGGEKLARIAIDAFNETHRLNEAQMKRLLREEAMLRENIDEDEEQEEEETDERNEDEGEDDLPDY